MRTGLDHFVGMGIEGDDHQWKVMIGTHLRRPGHDPLMTAVHAIEYPDRDHAAAPG